MDEVKELSEDDIALSDIVLWIKSDVETVYEMSRHAARMNIAGFTLLVVSLIAVVSWSDWKIGVMGIMGVLAAVFFIWMIWKSQSACWKSIGSLRAVWFGILFGKIRTVEAARKMILRSVPGVATELKVYERAVDDEKDRV